MKRYEGIKVLRDKFIWKKKHLEDYRALTTFIYDTFENHKKHLKLFEVRFSEFEKQIYQIMQQQERIIKIQENQQKEIDKLNKVNFHNKIKSEMMKKEVFE